VKRRSPLSRLLPLHLSHLISLAGLACLACLSAAAPGCSSSSDAPAAEAPAPAPPGEKDWKAEADRLLEGADWYRHAVFYEVFVRSFKDSNNDGIGDLQGLISKLDYLKELGIDAIWLMPIMPSPFKDSGYDTSDYQGINPDYGTMADFDALLAEAHKRKMRVMIDLVLNHTSDQHPWFEESRASKTGPKADWYVWSDAPDPPDNPCKPQQAIFGSSPWTLDPTRGQYYFHRFYPSQPDLNYRNPEVVDATLSMMNFWLDKGVDGFRCDVIALLYESAQGCDFIDETKEYVRKMRGVLDKHPGTVMVAESTDFADASAYFGNGSDMFHMAFDFAFGYRWSISFGGKTSVSLTSSFKTVIDNYPAGAQDALVIGSHDVVRAYSSAQTKEWRARRAFDISTTMRGTPFIYYGEELSLRPSPGKVVDLRDAQRGPMPWGKGEGHGFSSATPWLPFGPEADATSVEAEQADPASMLSYYKGLLALRRGHEIWGTGEVRLIDTDSTEIFVYARENKDEAYVIAVSLSDEPLSVKAAQAKLPSAGERVWGEGELTVEGDAASVSLPPESSAIFKVR
jgi:alpha-glucosidase